MTVVLLTALVVFCTAVCVMFNFSSKALIRSSREGLPGELGSPVSDTSVAGGLLITGETAGAEDVCESRRFRGSRSADLGVVSLGVVSVDGTVNKLSLSGVDRP